MLYNPDPSGGDDDKKSGNNPSAERPTGRWASTVRYVAVRCRRGGSAGGGPRPIMGAEGGGLGGEDGVGVRASGESEIAVPLRLGAPDASSMFVSWPGDEGVLEVSDARFALSLDTIDWSAADASETDGDSATSEGREMSGFVCMTCVEFARGGSGGGTRAG